MQKDESIQVVVAGLICLDIIPTFLRSETTDIRKIMVPGKLVNVGKVNVSTGGPVSNVGIALHKLGIRVKLMGKIGNDLFGNAILTLLKPIKADDGMTVVDGEETSYTVAIAPPGIDRIFLHNPGANDTFRADDVNYDLVSRASIFHFGYPPLMKSIYRNDGLELIKMFKRVKDLDVTTTLDMSLPDQKSESGQVDWEKILKSLLPHVDIFMPSVEETLFMIMREEFERLNRNAKGHDILENLDINILPKLGEKLIAYGTKIAVIKCGVKGYYIRTQGKEVLSRMGKAKPADLDNWANRELQQESFHVSSIASATGSGDSSIAGFIAAFLNGRSIEETIRIACAVGSQNLTEFDGVSGIKSWQETLAMIEKGWERNKINVHRTYWNYDAKKPAETKNS